MKAKTPILHHDRRLTGFAAVLAVHLALICFWQYAQRLPDASHQARKAIQWVDIPPPVPSVVTLARRDKAADRPAAPKKRALVVAVQAPSEPKAEAITEPVPGTPPEKSSYDILLQARRDLGKIDKDLKQEFRDPHIKKPADSPQIRLAKGMDEALAPPKWHEAPTVKESIDPGGYGRKRYRVSTAFGTHCVTQESNRPPGAHLDVGKRQEPKMTNCPQHEQTAMAQKWD